MSWSIAVLENEVKIPKKCAEELWVVGGARLDVSGDGRLRFSENDAEEMDYLGSDDYSQVIEILKKHKVKGDICFGSLEGDNKGDFWGYRFDGEGGMKHLKGKILWEEAVQLLTGKTIAVTGIFPNMTRKEVEEKIRGAGGEISGTVSVNTDWLVVGEKPGSKLQRAKE